MTTKHNEESAKPNPRKEEWCANCGQVMSVHPIRYEEDELTCENFVPAEEALHD